MSDIYQDSYKGNPILVIEYGNEKEYNFKFGVSKAKLIIEHLDFIKQFIEENDKPKEEEPPF